MRAVPERTTGRHIGGGRLVFGPSSARPLSAAFPDLARTESLWYSTSQPDFAIRSAAPSPPEPTGSGR
jgi:hypothetical protein